jgi:hypothetical protein
MEYTIDNKYTIISNNGVVKVLRYGEEWSYNVDKFGYTLIQTIEEQDNTINLLRDLYNNNFDLVEKYRDALEKITRQYDNTSVNRAKEIAIEVLKEDE